MPAERLAPAGRARCGDPAVAPLCEFTLPGEPMAVRATLERAMAALGALDLTEDCAATVELVLAEVLNNVVEHAYGGAEPGPIQFCLWVEAQGMLACSVCDRGRPMPDGTPPLGRQVFVDVPLAELPEGGFGWFLIRSLTRDLDYVRRRDGNRLSFRVPLERGPRPAG